MARKNLALKRYEIWDDGEGRTYANSPTGPISVDFVLARKHLIPAELAAEVWYEKSGAAPSTTDRSGEPIGDILTRFAETPNAFD